MGKMRAGGVSVLLLLSGCFPRVLIPDTPIARWVQREDGWKLRTCRVKLHWTAQELYDHCDYPDGRVLDDNEPTGVCEVYRNLMHPTTGGGAGAPFILVCHREEMEESKKVVRSPAGAPAGPRASMNDENLHFVHYSTKVTTIYESHGVQSLPPDGMKPFVAPKRAPTANGEDNLKQPISPP